VRLIDELSECLEKIGKRISNIFDDEKSICSCI
jgi:hypothetical protein